MDNVAVKPSYEDLVRRLEELEIANEKAERAKELLCEFEMKIKEREALLESIIASLPFDLFVIGKEGTYVLENPTCQKNYDGSIIGKRPEDLNVPEKTKEIWKSNNERAFKGETIDEEVSFKLMDKRLYYRNIISPIVVDDKITGIVGVNLDLEDKVERALLEQSLWDVFNYIRFYVVILDGRCRIKKVNTSLARALGFDQCSELVGRLWHDFLPSSIVKAQHLLMDSIRSGESQDSEFVSEIVGKGFERISVRWFHSPANSEWIFSVGIPLKLEIKPDDSIEDMRAYWQDCITKDRTMIRALRKIAESEWKQKRETAQLQ